MELNHVIIGSRLQEIQKKPDEIKLVFTGKGATTYVLTFEGLLFETASTSINERVKIVELTDTLGFIALTQLRRLRKNPNDYRQLFIQMDGSNDENKLELVGAVRNYKITSRRKEGTRLTGRSSPIKKSKAV